MVIKIVYILIFCIFSYLIYLIIRSIKRGLDAKNRNKKH